MTAMGLTCPKCGATFPDGLLACPGCGKLIHSERLKALAREAAEAEGEGDPSRELAAWRTASSLLPAGSAQRLQVDARIRDLVREIDRPGAPALPPKSGGKSGRSGATAGLTAVGLLLWKMKGFALLVLGKLKFLILGLSKAQTLLSMLLTMGIYVMAWGVKFAVGFVLSIYVHEMGHVAALRRYGIAATAPMFIPGFGAYVRLHQYPASPAEDARVGLAGPLWGLGAALFCAAVHFLGGGPIWGALARSGAYLNLFNLVPVWQLDGARGFHAVAQRERWVLAGLTGAAWIVTHESMLVFILAGMGYRLYQRDAPARTDARALAEFAFLLCTLSALCLIEVLVPR